MASGRVLSAVVLSAVVLVTGVLLTTTMLSLGGPVVPAAGLVRVTVS